MRLHEEGRSERGRHRGVILLALALPTVLLLSGCAESVQYGWLPTPERDTTNQTAKIVDLWNGSWIAALAVGVLVWGLTAWCVVVYRRRAGDAEIPPQVRYHIPLEILYTVVPIMMVGVLFFYTATAQAEITSTSETPDVTIGVVGKRWSWDFNYVDSGVYETGVQGQLDGTEKVNAELPVLYLPVNQRVEFVLTARDVIHSFWIPAFLYKMDTIPNVENRFQVVPQRLGTYQGKCAELCGEFHSEMLFNVKVVTQEEYDQHMADLRAKGQIGSLDADLGPNQLRPGGGAKPGNTATASATGSN